MAINPNQIINIPTDINFGLTSPSNKTLLQLFGRPRSQIDRKCRSVENQPLKSMIVTADVGPFKVTGLSDAVASLKRIFKKVEKNFPEVYNVIGSSGMACARLIKNSSKISNHSWGTALDINVAGALDGISVGGGTARLDGKTLAGLAAMAPYFNEEGWYWGVGFSTFEDGMHFEVADETLRKWHAEGKLGKRVAERKLTDRVWSKGDSGLAVRQIQQALIEHDFDVLADGEFGPITEGAVIEFQSANGLEPDGIVGPKTIEALFD